MNNQIQTLTKTMKAGNGRRKLTIAVTGLNNIDSPGPGIPVIRGLKEAASFEARIVGLAYENLEPGIYMPDCNFDDSPTPKGLGIRSEINCYMHEDKVEVTTLPLQTEVRPLLAN